MFVIPLDRVTALSDISNLFYIVFEAPKLQRQDINQITKTADLTDEELQEALDDIELQFGVEPKNLN
jgi:hypothetical protein